MSERSAKSATRWAHVTGKWIPKRIPGHLETYVASNTFL